MPDLKYDTDEMRTAAADYRDTAQTLDDVKTELRQQIAGLKSTHWRSDAGNAFLEMYEETWADNVTKYTAVLRHLAGLLDRAAGDYDGVSEQARQLSQMDVTE